MKVWMRRSSINGGLSIATLNFQRVKLIIINIFIIRYLVYPLGSLIMLEDWVEFDVGEEFPHEWFPSIALNIPPKKMLEKHELEDRSLYLATNWGCNLPINERTLGIRDLQSPLATCCRDIGFATRCCGFATDDHRRTDGASILVGARSPRQSQVQGSARHLWFYHLVMTHIAMEAITMLLIGKSR